MGGYGSYGSYGGAGYRSANIEAMRTSAAQNPTSTVYFKPRPGQDMLAYDTFVRALQGPRNELLRTFYARIGRNDLDSPADMPGSSASSPPPSGACLHVLVSMHARVMQSRSNSAPVILWDQQVL